MEFIPRKRTAQIWRVITAFIILALILLALKIKPDIVGGDAISIIFSLAAIAALGFYMVLRKQQNLDLVLATEFQNMMFAQAAAVGSNFCLFVKRDGAIEYANDGAHKIFTGDFIHTSSSFDTLLEKAEVGKTDRDKLMEAIIAQRQERVVFPLRLPGGAVKDYIFTVDPLPRPAGFLMVRGREFSGARTGTSVMPEVLRATSPERVEHLLTHSGVPHYVVNEYGRFEYVNPAFEVALGYAPGTVVADKLSLYHVLYQLRGQPVTGDMKLADILDQVTLQNKLGALLPAAIKQTLIRDEHQKIIGATGSIILAGAPA
ncbi:MAG: PAS domain-containing protein [Alphaproteobacteria bacterium]